MNIHGRFGRLLAILFTLTLVASACAGDSDDASPNVDTDADAPTDSGDSDDSDDAGDSVDSGDDAPGADTGADGSDAVSEGEVEPTRGGVLRIGLQTEAATLNPTNTGFNRSPVLIGTAIFDTLTVVDVDGQWQNNLTESWIPNDDFTAWDITVRDGVMFSDGTVMDADAVIRTIETLLADPLQSLVFIPVFRADDPIEKIDDMTFRIYANGPNSALPYYFAEQLGMIGSPAWLDARDEDASLDQMPIGAGPFVISERTQDSKTVVVRNENWWRADEEIWLDAIEFYPIVQDGTRNDQFLVGDLDLVHGTGSEAIAQLREESEGIIRIEDNSGEESMILLNAQKAPFDDIRVRQAATNAFPKQLFLDFITEGVQLGADTLFSPDNRWHVPGLEQPDDMPELAGPLIESYCADVPENCTDGRVDIEYQYDGPNLDLERQATIVRDAWEPFFNIEIQVVQNDDHIEQVIVGTYDSATWRYHGFGDPEIDTAFLTCATIGGLSINWSRNCNAERDELILAQRATQDFDERYAIWSDIQQDLRDEYQYILKTHTTWLVAASDKVGGLCDATSPDGSALPCQDRGVPRLSQLFFVE